MLRIFFCVLLPKNTGDLTRHLLYGGLVWRDGIGVLGRTLSGLPYDYPVSVWADHAYSYPVLAGGFFALLAGIWPTLFFAKLALTALEALNAWLIFRLTRERWMGLVYWLAPISVWWVSREGQFEPLQNTFALLALLIAQRRPAVACAVLALAVQSKLLSLALLPYLIVLAWRQSRMKGAILALLCFVAGYAPSVIANHSYPAFALPIAAAPPLPYNPYFWNLAKPAVFVWNPWWLVAANALASYAALAMLIFGAIKSKDRWPYLAPISFVLFIKTAVWVQFWYWILWPALIVSIPDRKIRKWLWLLYLVIDLSAIVAMILPKFGELVQWEHVVNLFPFEPIRAVPK